MPKRVLVTGGAGFIGSHVADLFISAGDEVSIVDDFSTGKRQNVPEGAMLHEMGIESSEFGDLVRSSRFDLVVHLAAQMDVRKSVADPVMDARTNIVGTLNLMEAVRATDNGTRIVLSSTGGVIYGPCVTPPNHETAPKDPESPYAISKLAGEYYLAYYGRVHGVECLSLRLGNVYGPRQDPHGEAGVVAIFCRALLAGSPVTIFGDGLQTRDYVYVGDVCSAIQRAGRVELPPPGKVDARAFNIGTGAGTSVLSLLSALEKVTGKKAQKKFAPKRPGEQQHSWIAPEKSAEILAWRAGTTLETGLKKTYQWFLENDVVAAQP